MHVAPRTAADSVPRRPRDRLTAVLILILTMVVHAASPVSTSTDSAWTFHVAASILREGNTNLDEYRPLMDLDADYRLRAIGSHIYSYYPAATPLLVTPVVLIANLTLPVVKHVDFSSYLFSHAPDDRTARLEKLVASVVVALAAALMYLVARLSAGRSTALLAAFILAFATSMWSTASRALWQHGPSALLLLAALYLTLAAPGKPWALFGAGLLLAFAYLVRPTNSISFAFFGLYYLLSWRREFWAYAAGGLTVLVPYGLSNLATYGNLLPPYSYQLFERVGTAASFTEAIVGTLVSPNRGLFVFSPVLLLAIPGVYRSLLPAPGRDAALRACIAGVLFTHWIVTSLFEDWGGAWSIGPRYFVDVLPFVVFMLLPSLASRDRWRLWSWITFALALAMSVAVQFHASTSPFPFMWNGKPRALVEAPERKWDWEDLQFLRGLCAQDRLEGRAPACWLQSHD